MKIIPETNDTSRSEIKLVSKVKSDCFFLNLVVDNLVTKYLSKNWLVIFLYLVNLVIVIELILNLVHSCPPSLLIPPVNSFPRILLSVAAEPLE